MAAEILDWQLVGKTVIVTGASSGIGAATAEALGSAGASVVLVGRDEPRLGEAAAAVESAGGTAHTAIAELTSVTAAEGVVDEALSAFGGLHGIVHSASIFDPRPLDDTTPESLEEQWRANVAAPLFMTRKAVPHLQPGSAVVLIGSGASRLSTDPGRGRHEGILPLTHSPPGPAMTIMFMMRIAATHTTRTSRRVTLRRLRL